MEKSTHSTFPLREALRNIGFTENEIKVLTYLFYAKKATPREVSREAVISFASAQYNLSNLSHKGLIRCCVNNETGEDDLYSIISEAEFETWIEDQKKKHDQIYDVAKIALGNFWTELENTDWKPSIRYYEGTEGIREIYEDILETSAKTDRKIRSWLDIKKLKMVLGDYLHTYIDQRMKRGIVSYDIVPKNETNLQYHKKKENREIRFAENFVVEGEIRIFGDKVSIISFNEKKIVGFVFQGEIYATLFRGIFESQWQNLSE